MSVDEETQKSMRERMGMIPMETEVGLKAFYRAFSSGQPQVLTIWGSVEKLESLLLGSPEMPTALKHPISPDQSDDQREVHEVHLLEGIVHRIKTVFGGITKHDPSRIDPDDYLENFGIDSIMVSQLNRSLEDSFPSLSKTLFYEYPTLREVSRYLVETDPQACREWIGEDIETPIMEKETLITAKGVTEREAKEAIEPIAIIGISCRFPQADTLNVFWENVKTAKTCITEIPEDRWNWRHHYHPNPTSSEGKKKSYGKWGAFLSDSYHFDALFFKYDTS
jgi:acyl carrier protein